MVYAKRPFGGPEQVLKYLARYTHRIAIAKGRLVSFTDGQVAFRWRDSADGNAQKIMSVDAIEFTRRFLLHVLPAGFVKIRHFGFLANANRRASLSLWRSLLAQVGQIVPQLLTDPQARAVQRKCPLCRVGTLRVIAWIGPEAPNQLRYADSRRYIMSSSVHLVSRRLNAAPQSSVLEVCPRTYYRSPAPEITQALMSRTARLRLEHLPIPTLRCYRRTLPTLQNAFNRHSPALATFK